MNQGAKAELDNVTMENNPTGQRENEKRAQKDKGTMGLQGNLIV